MTSAAYGDPQRTIPDPPSPPARRMRPRDRRIVQALAVAVLLPAFLVLKWVDQSDGAQQNLKPPEKVTSVAHGAVGHLADAQWKVVSRGTEAPLGSGDRQDGDATELQVVLAVRPETAAAAKTIGSYGVGYFFEDGDGRTWSAGGIAAGTPRQGVAGKLTVKGTVPRSEAAALALVVKAPKASRKKGKPLPSLRFAP